MSKHEVNPFPCALPVRVLLRERKIATVEQIVEDSTFPLLGHLGTGGKSGDLSHLVDDGQPSVDLEGKAPAAWRIDGRFSEDGSAHPLDIIGVIIKQVAGAAIAMPFMPAAGHKGGSL